jgi:hypothetical protein
LIADLIDVWDVETFGEDLIAQLRANAGLVRDYTASERAMSLERYSSRRGGTYRGNPHTEDYLRFLESLGQRMKHRAIRAWHYTRLTDSEVDALRRAGVHLSNLETMRQRLDAQVATGQISVEIANALFEKTPLRESQQVKSRSNRFWMTSHPLTVEDHDVALLLKHWGGEVVYFWLEADKHLQQVVSGIGTARVIEIGVPLDATDHAYVAGKAIAATFARSLGHIPDFGAFDVCAVRPLGPETILAVYTEGEATFDRIGRGYPINFHVSE